MKIFISAYLNNNLGDDLMIDLLCKRYPEHSFYISNGNQLQQIACENNNLYILPPLLPTDKNVKERAINKALSYAGIPKVQLIRFFRKNKFDMYIELGGSIYMQVTPFSWINKVRDSMFIIKNVKYKAVIGCNFGPYTSESFLKKHMKLFNKFDWVSFRDETSYSLFSTLNNVKCYPDLVFNIKMENYNEYRERKNINKTIGISVVGLQNKGLQGNVEKYLFGLQKIIDSYLFKQFSILLVCFCENEGDLETCNEIIRRGNYYNKNVDIYIHKSTEKSMQVFSELDGIVATRFHAIILALIFNIPVVPIIYSMKTLYELQDLEYQGYAWNILKGEELDIEKCDIGIQQKNIINKKRVGEAKGHFKYLDSVLENESK